MKHIPAILLLQLITCSAIGAPTAAPVHPVELAPAHPHNGIHVVQFELPIDEIDNEAPPGWAEQIVWAIMHNFPLDNDTDGDGAVVFLDEEPPAGDDEE